MAVTWHSMTITPTQREKELVVMTTETKLTPEPATGMYHIIIIMKILKGGLWDVPKLERRS